MKGLYSYYEAANDEIAALKWHIYNANDHGRLITNDYGSIPCSEMQELDGATVVSCNVRTTKKGRYVAAYVRF